MNTNNYNSYAHYNEATIPMGNPATEVLRIDQLVHQDDWVCDSERYRCHVCTRNFNSFRRKHHCRRCGEVVCRNCTLYKEAELPVIGRSRVRICMSCILAHANSYHASKSQTQMQAQGQTQDGQAPLRNSGNPTNDPYPVPMISPRGTSAVRNTEKPYTQVARPSNFPAKPNNAGRPKQPKNLHVQTQNKVQNTWIHSPVKDQSSDHESDGISHTINNSSSLRDLPQQLSFDYPLDYTWEHPWPKPPIVPNDEERIQVLKSFEIMDTPQEDVFDIICELASNALKCPIAAVSLIDEERQWFKASIGIAQAEIPRGVSFCAHTIMTKEPLYILDTTKDIRFEHNPLVTGPAGIRFYGGAPICASTGHVLGTVFVFDTKPHDSCDVATLEKLSNVAMKNLEDRKNSIVSPIVSRSGAMTRNVRSNSKGKREINSYPADQLKETEQQLVAATTPNHQVTVSGNGSTSEQQIVSGAKMESMLMDLLCRTTETQQQLATQQGAIFHTLGQHTDQIDKLANAVARMEAKLDDLESDFTVKGKPNP